ncbi:MAG: hypothetical protein ACLFNB_02280 [Candidatus Woesearchaeota archaeon]
MSQDVNKLTETLYSSGLAGSPGEARRMAEDMLSTSKKVARSSEENQRTNFAVRKYKRPAKDQELETAQPPQESMPEIKTEEKPETATEPSPQQEYKTSPDLEPEKREAYNKEFRERALAGKPIDIQVEFDTPRRTEDELKRKKTKSQDHEEFKSQFQASDIPESHSEYKSPETSRSPNTEQYDVATDRESQEQETSPSQDMEFQSQSPQEQGLDSSPSDQDSSSWNAAPDTATQKTTGPEPVQQQSRTSYLESEAPNEPQPSSFSSGSLLDQAIRSVNSNDASGQVKPEQYSAQSLNNSLQQSSQQQSGSKLSSDPAFPQEQEQEQPTENNQVDERTQQQSEAAKEAPKEGKRREMTEEEKKQQDDVDLTKHFNFSNK